MAHLKISKICVTSAKKSFASRELMAKVRLKTGRRAIIKDFISDFIFEGIKPLRKSHSIAKLRLTSQAAPLSCVVNGYP